MKTVQQRILETERKLAKAEAELVLIGGLYRPAVGLKIAIGQYKAKLVKLKREL